MPLWIHVRWADWQRNNIENWRMPGGPDPRSIWNITLQKKQWVVLFFYFYNIISVWLLYVRGENKFNPVDATFYPFFLHFYCTAWRIWIETFVLYIFKDNKIQIPYLFFFFFRVSLLYTNYNFFYIIYTPSSIIIACV